MQYPCWIRYFREIIQIGDSYEKNSGFGVNWFHRNPDPGSGKKQQRYKKVTALAAGSNIEALEAQIREFRPEKVCVFQEEKAKELQLRIPDLSVKVLSGMDGLIEAAAGTDAEIVVTAVVGMIGIRPTIAAMEAGKDIALANKETLVTAGHIIMPLAKGKERPFLPVQTANTRRFSNA